MKTETKTLIQSLVDGFKKFYVTKLKGFEPEKICAATLLFQVKILTINNGLFIISFIKYIFDKTGI